jgi:hypothetical protein
VDHEALVSLGESSTEVLRVVCEHAGLSLDVGEKQSWHVGGRTLTVEWFLNERGCYRLRLLEGWPSAAPKRRALLMAEVFALASSGVLRDLRQQRAELARWKARLVIEAGLVEAPIVSLPPLPVDAPQSAGTTWQVIESLVRVRRLTDDDADDQRTGIPLVAPYLARWSGVSESTFVAGKRWLADHGYIEHVGDGPGSFGNPTRMWRVAGAPQHERRHRP